MTRSARWTAAAIAAAVAAACVGVAVTLWVAVSDDQSAVSAAFVLGSMLAFTLVGAVVAAARPANRVGWVMLAGAALSSLGGGGAALAHHGIVSATGSVAGVSAYAIAGQSFRSLGWYLLTLGVPYVFPDGRPPQSGWVWLRRLFPAVLVAAAVSPLLDKQADLTGLGAWQNPIAPTGAWQVFSGAAFLTQVPGGLVAAGGMIALLVSRWRSGDPLRRQQLTLFVAAVAFPIVAVPLVFALGFTSGPWVFGATALPLPFALGFAVLARGLYDLRTAVNRTLVWVTLSGVVVGVYTLVIAGIGDRLDVHGARWLPWVAAAVVAISFAPLRDVLQRAVNRITYGGWDEPYDVLAALGQRVEATADADRLLADLVVELTGLGLPGVAIRDASGELIAHDGAPVGPEAGAQIPLLAYGELMGKLQYLPPATALRSRDRQLLDDLAAHLGGVLHAMRLTRDLQRSREQLVLAREEERRRLRRDLHDGLGPALAGHLLRLDLVATRIGRTDPSALHEVDSLRDDLRGTVSEVRRVVEGLRPPALDELGLVGALEQVTQRLAAGTRTHVSVTATDVPPLSAAIEVAAFRIATEAVTNAVKHADASRCDVTLGVSGGRLHIIVTDDGRGLEATDGGTPGHGLQTMRERAEELRGRLRITPGPDHRGCRVSADLPLPVAAPRGIPATPAQRAAMR